MTTQTFHRDRFTWLAYLLLAFYGYFLNILGPITPFLKDELQLSYTVSSLHFTAFAVGILLVGFGGDTLVQRIGRGRALWLGAFGMSISALLLIAGRTAVLTIGASFCMGLVGSLILVIIPSTLSDYHGEGRAVALSEANVMSSLISTTAPLMVGWTAGLFGGWRLALAIGALAPLLIWLGFGSMPVPEPVSSQKDSTSTQEPLPALFWVYWVAIVLAVSVEFCMLSWSADYLEKSLHLLRVDAARSVSLFLAGMIIGRMTVSRLVQRFAVQHVVTASIALAGVGFAAFWTAKTAMLGLVGLFITGLGVAGIYPLLLSMAIGVAHNNTTQASARGTLASGTAILALPLVLGRLADMTSIGQAYGVVVVLLVALLLTTLAAQRKA